MLLAAIVLALAAYWWMTSQALPERQVVEGAGRGKRPAVRRNPQGWNITVRSCKVLGISMVRVQMFSWISAVAIGVAWAILVKAPLAGLVMGYAGYQFPGMYVELRASGVLDLLQRQVSIFVSSVNDALHMNGKTAEDAMATACEAVRNGPLEPATRKFLQMTDAGVGFSDRVHLLGNEVDLPAFSFFADLMQIREQTGVQQMSRAFQILDEKFQDDERIITSIRGEIGTYAAILFGAMLLNFLVFPAYRFLDPTEWPIIAAHLGVLIVANTIATVAVLMGVRHFLRARVVAD